MRTSVQKLPCRTRRGPSSRYSSIFVTPLPYQPPPDTFAPSHCSNSPSSALLQSPTMQLYLLALIWSVAAYIVYTIISKIVLDRRHAAEAKRLGCKPVQTLPNTLPLAIDRVYEAISADRKKLFPNVIQDRWDEMGGRTYDYYLMGNKGFFTAEPKNIQAMLATQFNDFCTGESTFFVE